MKKIILSLALALLGFVNLYAVKAKPNFAKKTLADGTTVSVTLHGDENFHYYTLLDGTPLRLNEQGKYVVSSEEELKVQSDRAQQACAKARLTSRASISSSSYVPHTGSLKILIILVQFQDVKFKSSDPVATFTHFFNGKIGEEEPVATKAAYTTDETHQFYGGVKQYFSDVSGGKFTPEFNIVGPVTVSQKLAYYGANDANGSDKNYQQMISEACQLVDDQVNFADYDTNNDGYVDLVDIIYAGYSESISGNSDDCLWPKTGFNQFYQVVDSKSQTTELKLDGKRFGQYSINNELNETPNDEYAGKYFLNGIGVFCHEFSHTMGMPDLYPTNGLSNDNQSPEYWSLMDMGEYTDNSYRPTPYSPWERSVMGWSEPILLSSTEPQQITMEPYGTSGISYKIENGNEAGEYLLLENIQNEGWYKELPGYGLLVWRIDYADKRYVGMFDYPNDTKDKPRVMIVPADGLVINTTGVHNGLHTNEEYVESMLNDPFPAYKIGEGGSDVNSLTSVQLNYSVMNNRPLYNIKKDEATGLVTFDYLKNYVTAITPVVSPKNEKPTEYYDLEGRKILTPQKGHLYVTNKGKKVIY